MELDSECLDSEARSLAGCVELELDRRTFVLRISEERKGKERKGNKRDTCETMKEDARQNAKGLRIDE